MHCTRHQRVQGVLARAAGSGMHLMIKMAEWYPGAGLMLSIACDANGLMIPIGNTFAMPSAPLNVHQNHQPAEKEPNEELESPAAAKPKIA